VVSSSIRDFFTASASVAGALIGLTALVRHKDGAEDAGLSRTGGAVDEDED
jgi:hypothetical protein